MKKTTDKQHHSMHIKSDITPNIKANGSAGNLFSDMACTFYLLSYYDGFDINFAFAKAYTQTLKIN